MSALRRSPYVRGGRATRPHRRGRSTAPATSRCSTWLTQPGPHSWRPRTRATVLLVAGQHRQAQVRAERLGHRSRRGPALAVAGERVQRSRPGDRPEVIVLDQQRVGVLRRARRAARARARRRARRPSGSARAASRSTAPRAPRERGRAARAGIMPRSSIATGSSSMPCARSRSNSGRVAGVLDGDAVAGPQPRCEHPLDAVQGAAERRTALRRARRRRARARARELDQLGQLGGLAVEANGLGAAAQRRGEIGQQRRVGVARGRGRARPPARA